MFHAARLGRDEIISFFVEQGANVANDVVGAGWGGAVVSLCVCAHCYRNRFV
jgi:galactokinase